MKNQPRVSLIITNYNGARYITQCLDSIFKSSLSDCEVIFVDDGSTDKSREILQNYKNHPRLKLIFQKENQGPAKARNQGAGKAQGEYLFFLDVDTKIEKDCPRTIVSKFEQNKKIGALQAKLIQAKTGNIETAGHFLSFLGFPYEIRDSEVENHHNKEREIFGARSAAFAIRKNLFEKIGCFDEDYFIYGEDTDLSWRVWLSGFHVIFLPQAKVFHFGKSSLNPKTEWRLFYEGAKNNTNYILKNASLRIIFSILPLHLLGWFILSLKLILQGRFSSAIWIYKGFWWNIINLPKTVHKRKMVNRYRDKNSKVENILFGNLKIHNLLKKGFKWFREI